ncbi:MAG: hypothetical protein GY937_07975 [bacterium]|nr:hypothetical protein [bacterium]
MLRAFSWLVVLAFLPAAGAAQTMLFPGQTGNQIEITIGNTVGTTTLTGVSILVPDAPKYITIDSITPKGAILEPGRSETFTIVFSVKGNAPDGAAESIALRLQADQAVTFDIPVPTFDVAIGAASPAASGADLAARVARLEALRAQLDAAADGVRSAATEASDAAGRVDGAAADLAGTSFDAAAAQADCVNAVSRSTRLTAAAVRMERSEGLVDTAVRGAEAIATSCSSADSAARIDELLDNAHSMTVEMGIELESMRADAKGLGDDHPERARIELLLDVARRGAAEAQAAAARGEPLLTTAAELRHTLDGEKALFDAAAAQASALPDTPALVARAAAATAGLPEPSAEFTAGQQAATEAAARLAEAETTAKALLAALVCDVGKDTAAVLARAENAHTGALIHLGASDPLRTRAAECLAANPPPAPPPTPTAALLAITNLVVSGAAGGAPIEGNAVIASIDFDAAYDGMVAITCTRGHDGHDGGGVQLLGVKPGPQHVDCLFPEMSLNGHPFGDSILVTLSDGDKTNISRTARFSWQKGDKYLGMSVVDSDSGQHGPKFPVGGELMITTQWGLNDFGTGNRTIRYLANGTPFAEEPISDTAGATVTHTAHFPVTRKYRGKLEIRVQLFHPDGSKREGSETVRTVDVRDQIIAVSVTTGQGSPVNRVPQSTQVFVPVVVELGEGLKGSRTLELSNNKGAVLGRQSFSSDGGETVNRAFMVDTSGLRPGRYALSIRLTDPNGKRDRKIREFHIQEPPLMPPPRNTGGLDDRVCSGDAIQVLLHDHGIADGDIVSLGVGGQIVAPGRNLNNGCHPDDCLVHTFNLKPGERTTISVYAHNTGTNGPNTAELVTMGGCSPDRQEWSLEAGESGAIWVSRP